MTQSNNQNSQNDQNNSSQRNGASDSITKQEEELANDLPNLASYQASPLTDDPARAARPETETAERVERAAGLDPHEHHLADSERAYTESRGSNEPRTPGYLDDQR